MFLEQLNIVFSILILLFPFSKTTSIQNLNKTYIIPKAYTDNNNIYKVFIFRCCLQLMKTILNELITELVQVLLI